ncbi:Endonuclease/exonuclease/phosphatase [Gigaspora margarita]|uniref:Endonuclease/exonuclease/phosphatase n=1 Tax=Gigaspora margarita TaxID=4874 RepID=A0A8H4AP97_GIGMA|nr:Endonuclease/exonuclease/phosphatase [Gigaspora margarita]
MVSVLFPNVEETDQKRITIMTYNLLAQTLVRRELFPESGDAIKWKNRRPRLLKEILHYKPDVSCFQEMDHSNYDDTFKSEFENAGYETCFAGIGKTHGCCIIWKRSKFTKLDDLTIEFDRFGTPTMTTNCIGLIVSLKYCETLSGELNSGLVIGTTHLYWRPQSMYERARQCLILCENLLKFKEKFGFEAILAGDFNSTPTDPTYKLMVKNTSSLTEDEILTLETSMRPFGEDANSNNSPSTKDIVEDCVDNNADSNVDSTISDNNAGLLKNSSTSSEIPITQKTLLSMSAGKSTQTEPISQFQPTLPDLLSKFTSLPPCVSMYAQHLNSIDPENTIYSEPKFTNYGLHFKGALDYIFLFCQNDDNRNNGSKVKVTKLLKMPPEEELLPLIPNYKFNSDHLCLMVELIGLV